jgi:hypothetical protein
VNRGAILFVEVIDAEESGSDRAVWNAAEIAEIGVATANTSAWITIVEKAAIGGMAAGSRRGGRGGNGRDRREVGRKKWGRGMWQADGFFKRYRKN